jgi:hypothetical protein
VHINKKALLFALLILGVASEALASDHDGNQGTVQLISQTSAHGRHAQARAEARGSYGSARARRPSADAAGCPSYEGYPDCNSGSTWGSTWGSASGSTWGAASGSARGSRDSNY